MLAVLSPSTSNRATKKNIAAKPLLAGFIPNKLQSSIQWLGSNAVHRTIRQVLS